MRLEKKIKELQKAEVDLVNVLEKDVLKLIVAAAVATSDDYSTYEAVWTMVRLIQTCTAFRDVVDRALWISTQCMYYKKKDAAQPTFLNQQVVVVDWLKLYKDTLRREISNRKWVQVNNRLRDVIPLAWRVA